MTQKIIQSTQATSRQLLSRILEVPNLAKAVQGLAPHALGRLIQHIGLEDAGELLPFATTQQLITIFDGDLWTPTAPGQDEVFDAERFVTWLEVMLEAGEDLLANRLAELPEDLVTLAFSSHILVLNMDELAIQFLDQDEDDNDLTEKALESCLYQEIDEYRIISKRPNGWDAIITALVALDKEHHDLLVCILERCYAISSDYIEENGGLYHVLSSEEGLEADASGEREERRAREGFIAPSAAASFLGLARLYGLTDEHAPDVVTSAYFRALEQSSNPTALPTHEGGESTDTKELTALLQEAEILETAPSVRQLEAKPNTQEELYKNALLVLAEKDPLLHSQQSAELAYLINVLLSGCSFMGRSLLPMEAFDVAISTCNLGLEHLGGAVEQLAQEGTVRLFRVGWRLLYQELSLGAAHTLEQAMLKKIKDSKGQKLATQLKKAGRVLRKAVSEGKPWKAREKMVVAYEGPAWVALNALLDECPSLAGALLLEGEPRFVSTKEKLWRAQSFLRELAPGS